MGTGVTLAVLPPETFCSPRRSGFMRSSRSERDNRFGWQLQVRLEIERTVHYLARNLLRGCFLLFPKDGLGKFYD